MTARVTQDQVELALLHSDNGKRMGRLIEQAYGYGRAWQDEAPYFARTGRLFRIESVPPPKRGGTWVYCTSQPDDECRRFRTEAAYRRHWRRCHA